MIDTARMTLWSSAEDERWPQKYHDALLWSLSAFLARKWFKRIEILTDSSGARFVERIGLPFDTIDAGLDNLPKYPFWAAGKIRNYQLAQAPFIHLDHDVFLLRPLPDRILRAATAAQSSESTLDEEWYPLYRFMNLCDDLPFEWHRAICPGRLWWFKRESLPAYNAGIMGGNDVEAIRRFASSVLRIAEANPRLKELAGTKLSIVLEQFGFGAEIGQSRIETLLGGPSQPYAPAAEMEKQAMELGYCHLCGEWKYDESWRAKVENRLKVTFPSQFEFLERNGLLRPAMRVIWRKKGCFGCEPVMVNLVYEPPAVRSRARQEAKLEDE